MKVKALSYSDIGARPENEDSVGVVRGNGMILAIVADGLGAHGRGREASQIAVDVICKSIRPTDELNEDCLEEAIIEANREICKYQTNEFEMKTTAAALWIKDDRAVSTHIGDSRIYRIRGGKIDFHTDDHSVAYIAYKFGEISFDELSSHPEQNKLIRCLGCEEKVVLDTTVLNVMEKDVFLACSDGFWELLTSKELENAVESSKNIREIYDRFVQIIAASTRPYRDNCTFAIVTVSGEEDENEE